MLKMYYPILEKKIVHQKQKKEQLEYNNVFVTSHRPKSSVIISVQFISGSGIAVNVIISITKYHESALFLHIMMIYFMSLAVDYENWSFHFHCCI